MSEIHVTLRRDQAECVLEALDYICGRFQNANTDQPAVCLACRLAKQRAREVKEIFLAAMKEDGP